MKKIVILGCENSHANGFLDIITKNPNYADIQVVGVYSEDTEAAQKLNLMDPDTFDRLIRPETMV